MRRRDMIRNSVLAAAVPMLPLGAAILTEERAEAQDDGRGAYTLRLNDGDILVLEGRFPEEQLLRLRQRLREAGKNNIVIITLPQGHASVFPAREVERLHDRIHEMRRSR
jgi:hypothetical protein